jgi:hypothetical protein
MTENLPRFRFLVPQLQRLPCHAMATAGGAAGADKQAATYPMRLTDHGW